MKAYTDINQSKKLAEILPIESADMYYQYVLPKSDRVKHNPEIGNPISALEWYNKGYTMSGKEPITMDEYCVPCWSLAALLDVLESEIDGENGETYKLNIEKDGTWWDVWYCEEHDEENPIETTSSEELIDVCYEMILELKERNLVWKQQN